MPECAVLNAVVVDEKGSCSSWVDGDNDNDTETTKHQNLIKKTKFWRENDNLGRCVGSKDFLKQTVKLWLNCG